MKTPIFIFSLPRSGSTLLQRILMSHTQISSASEPWLLLPLVYLTKKQGGLAEYSHASSFNAIEYFISNLPNKDEDFNIELKHFIVNLYSKYCFNNEKYFLDKTPRYYLIIEEISKIFPEAKFIFLFRNPLYILSSIIKTFSNGNLKQIHGYNIDLELGFERLSNGFLKFKNKSHSMNYENLISNPTLEVKKLCKYLNIKYSEQMLSNFSKQNLQGKFGDSISKEKYRIKDESLNKIRETLNTRFRVKFARNYIRKLNDDDLKIQGYDKKKILKSLVNITPNLKLKFMDYFFFYRGKIIVRFKLNLFFGLFNKEIKKKYLS